MTAKPDFDGVLTSKRTRSLLYADDFVILSDNPADLQAGSWRFHFAVGPQKTAVMCFGPGQMRGAKPRFRLGNKLVPIVNTYTYLGIVFHENLQWRHHVDHVLARGEARIAACISWTASEDLPVHLTEHVFQTYVCPSVYFGLEFISQQSQLQRMKRRMFQWGRRLLMWPQGATTAAVQGQLGWADIASVRLLRVAGLWALLLSSPNHSLSAQIAQAASRVPSSFIASAANELLHLGVTCPIAWGIVPGCAPSLVKGWLRHVKVLVQEQTHTMYSHALLAIDSSNSYAVWQPRPRLHPIVYGRHVPASSARAWGLARCGHHCFCDGRTARHLGSSAHNVDFAHTGKIRWNMPYSIVAPTTSCEKGGAPEALLRH